MCKNIIPRPFYEIYGVFYVKQIELHILRFISLYVDMICFQSLDNKIHKMCAKVFIRFCKAISLFYWKYCFFICIIKFKDAFKFYRYLSLSNFLFYKMRLKFFKFFYFVKICYICILRKVFVIHNLTRYVEIKDAALKFSNSIVKNT